MDYIYMASWSAINLSLPLMTIQRWEIKLKLLLHYAQKKIKIRCGTGYSKGMWMLFAQNTHLMNGRPKINLICEKHKLAHQVSKRIYQHLSQVTSTDLAKKILKHFSKYFPK